MGQDATGRIISTVEHNGFEMQFLEDDAGRLWGRVIEVNNKLIENGENINTDGGVVAVWLLRKVGA